MADWHILQSELNVTRQRVRIAASEQAGEETSRSTALLRTFETSLGLHYAYRRIFRASLGRQRDATEFLINLRKLKAARDRRLAYL